jgi:hypothetical protein
MFKQKHHSEYDTGIFKKLSKNMSNKECFYLNLLCNQDCYCKIDEEKNIKRICFNNDVYNHEKHIYLTLLKYNANISTMISIHKNEIVYITNNLVSLRTFLINNKSHISLIINETFAFINKFKQYHFIHGNLHIDNIYINIKNGYTFHVIDLCNSYITNEINTNTNKNERNNNSSSSSSSSSNPSTTSSTSSTSSSNYKRKSFMNKFIHVKKNLIKTYLHHSDFLSLFISLKMFFEKKNPKYISYIQTIICNYIGKYNFDETMKHLNQNEIKEKYHSI